MHVFGAHHVFFSFYKLWVLSLAVKAVAPLPSLHEGDLCHITLFANDVPIVDIVFRVSVASRHEAERNLVGEWGVEVVSNLKEISEGRLFKNVFIQELSHDVVLDFEGDRFKIFKLLAQDRGSIIFPEVVEVPLNLLFHCFVDVSAFVEGRIPDVLDNTEPLL